MCGIVYGVRKDGRPVGKPILKRYQKQRLRGHEGFGLIAIKDGVVAEVGRYEKEHEVSEYLGNQAYDEVIFHHRAPTSTPNLRDLNHPITVKNDMLRHNYYVVHNGVLTNEEQLRVEHEQLGFVYTTVYEDVTIRRTKNSDNTIKTETFNDSEAFAIDLALYLDGVTDIMKSRGGSAFVCVEADKDDRVLAIHYGCNLGRSLKIERNKDLMFVKSEGDGEDLLSNKMVSIDYTTKDEVVNDVNIGMYTIPPRSGYGGRHDVDDPKDWWPEGVSKPIGFSEAQDNHTLHLPGAIDHEFPGATRNRPQSPSEYALSEDKLWDMIEELNDLNRDIEFYRNEVKHCNDMNERDEWEAAQQEAEEQRDKLEEQIQFMEDFLNVSRHDIVF